MQVDQQGWKNSYLLLRRWRAENFQRYILIRVTQKCCIGVMLTLVVLGAGFAFNGGKVDARSFCARGAVPDLALHGNTLSKVASRSGVPWRRLDSNRRLANPILLHLGQVTCVAGVEIHEYIPVPHPPRRPSPPTPPIGSRNFFPYGACTWWADQRYFQLHGVFVPWRTQANAWEWVARAFQFNWRVSSRPSPGAIVVLQPWVQGASGMGHVAVVERMLTNGRVIASNMSWGPYPWQVTYVQFSPGPGVTFIML